MEAVYICVFGDVQSTYRINTIFSNFFLFFHNLCAEVLRCPNLPRVHQEGAERYIRTFAASRLARGGNRVSGQRNCATARTSSTTSPTLLHRRLALHRSLCINRTPAVISLNNPREFFEKTHFASGTRGAASASAAADRLSALPDALLHRIMSSLKAWEVVRTCVLSRRWRHLWASAPCVDLRVHYSRLSGHDDEPPEEFRDFVHRLFLLRDVSAPVDTLRLQSSEEDAGFDEKDANTWIRTAIKRNARVIHLVGHRKGLALMENVPFVSCHLKILKLSYARLDERILRQLSSRCTSLKELDLKDCLVTGREIVSASLKTLTMLKCTFNWEFSIAAPNLILLCLVTPYIRVPSFKNLGSLVTSTITLDDSFLGNDYDHISDEDDLDGTTDDDSACNNDDDDERENYRIDDDSSWGDDDFGYMNDFDDDFEDINYFQDYYDEITGFPRKIYKDNYDYGSDIDSDDSTYEYSEVADDPKYDYHGDGHNTSKDGNYRNYDQSSESNDKKILGGHNILYSLSNARSLELLTNAGEVVLSRELKKCPTFGNLKTLSLGEWCMAADFDALVFLLQHSPNIERLFLKLTMNFNTRKTLETGIKLQERSFACTHVEMVKINCSKDDARVHKLAHLFRANGVPFEKIYVRRSENAHLRGQKEMREFAKHELEFWGM